MSDSAQSWPLVERGWSWRYIYMSHLIESGRHQPFHLLVNNYDQAVAINCKDALVDGTNCYLDEADNVVRKNNIDPSSMAKCIDRVTDSCSTVIKKQFGQAIKNIDPKNIKDCAFDAIEPVKDGMEKCLNGKGYKSDYTSPEKIYNRPGAQVVGLIVVIKVGYKNCRPMLNCLPSNFDDFKRDICAAENKCFPSSTLNQCPNMEGDLERDVCDCYKSQSNKEKQLQQFENCLSSKDRRFVKLVGSHLTNNVLLNEVEKQVCTGSAHYTDKYDICKDDSFGPQLAKGRSGGFNGNGFGGLINRG